MKLVKIAEQIVGDIVFDVYELQHKAGGNIFPKSLSFDSIQELPRFKEVTGRMTKHKIVVIGTSHGSTLRVKVKHRLNSYIHDIGDGIDIDNLSFYRDLVSVTN